MKLALRIIDESEYPMWNRFVESSPTGSVYSSTHYLSVLAKAVNATVRVAVVENAGTIVGGIALLESDTRWGRILDPRLLLQYNGIVLGKSESKYPSYKTSVELKVIEQIARFLEDQSYASMMVKCRWPFMDVRALLARGWSVIPTYTYIVPLTDLEQQWDRVDRNTKRLIRRCSGEGIVVTQDDDFDSFYRMHKETHERKGAPLYLDRQAFRAYFQELFESGVARLFHARLHDGKSVAAQLVLTGGHNMSETVSACADSNYLSSGASAYLRWSSFERLAESGFRQNDLTDASLNNVTRFKSQFGGDLRICLACLRPTKMSFRIGTGLENCARALLQHLRSARTYESG